MLLLRAQGQHLWQIGAMKALLVLLVIPAIGCADPDHPDYLAKVELTMQARADADGKLVVAQRDISSQDGNPYLSFLMNARIRLEREPARIDIETIKMSLGNNAGGVANLGEVFRGHTEALLILDSSGAPTVAAQTEVGEIALDEITFTTDFPDDISGARLELLRAGGFPVSVRGEIAPGFAERGVAAPLTVAISFAAYKFAAPTED